VVTADDVDTLLFDVLGTVVDEAGSMRAELAAALVQAGDGEQAAALATAWAQRFDALVSAIGQGAPWRSTDDLNAEALAGVLRDGPRLPAATVQYLALAGHRLRPWPDAQAALGRLARRFTVVALSNGNLSMLTDLFASAGCARMRTGSSGSNGDQPPCVLPPWRRDSMPGPLARSPHPAGWRHPATPNPRHRSRCHAEDLRPGLF
jgi:phosphoglycolate phosphatase-like HAD superfamily hydrolase